MTQNKSECPKGLCCDLMLGVCACSQGVSTVQILQPSLGYTPSFSSCISVLLLAGLTGTKPAPALPPPPAGPRGEAGPMAGAAPSSPAVERALTGLVCRASKDLSRLLQAACRTARCLAPKKPIPQGKRTDGLRRRPYKFSSDRTEKFALLSNYNRSLLRRQSGATNCLHSKGWATDLQA